MKKFFLIFHFIFLFFYQTGSANVSIVYIDMDNIMSTSIVGKSILRQLNDANNNAIQEFQQIEKDFKVQENKILSQKNIIIGKSELDISMDIVKLINIKIKEFKIK